ncbi:unnamed protein product [Parnassius apollo]|uniref:(apollo) hypothetical protein n=1 Tax=Parnassius apollo TaxID=110799 RepID=A0A8S3XHW0_PARAO|nr:unnamed protein product [Parnassius apollo]
MKWLILSSFLVCWARFGVRCEQAALSEAQLEQSIEVQCLVGTEWETNCYQCRCLPSGIAQCRKQESCDTSPGAEPIMCKPNTVFYRDCNSCLCLANGNVQCSTNTCQRSDTPKKSYLLPGKECAPGSKWMSQCNECTCSSEGHPTCTETKCPGQETERKLSCAPETVWKDDCNRCWCSSDGYALCTKMGCSVVTALDFNVDSEDKEIGELEPALKSNVKEVNGTKAIICSANRMFIKDCNTCWCNEDGTSYFCTRKVCVELPEEVVAEVKSEQNARIVMKQCRPDEVFEIDCNMCRCNADGKSFSCTRRACYPEDDMKDTSLIRKTRASPQEPPKACQPGQEFRMDCNKCLCDNEGQDFSCTRIDCNALNNNNNGGARRKRDTTEEVTVNCTAGTVFQKGCNVCRCGEDGLRATCTAHDCDQIKVEHGDDASDADSNFRCNPGEQFKRECNDCTCSADGKSVFCTIRLCFMYQP